MTEPDIRCQLCGSRAEDAAAALTWVMDRQGERVSWTCPDCAARHVRSIEAKLDQQWW